MRENFGFRVWFYFRIGWTTYFALFFAGINTATVTYFLAIEKIPELVVIFPSFLHYVTFSAMFILPLLVMVGWFHYRRTAAYGTEAEVQTENNPYIYKIPPGYRKEVILPVLLKLTEFMIKSSNNEKFDDKHVEELNEIQKKIDILMKGGKVGSVPSGKV